MQHMLMTTISVQGMELTEGNSDWIAAKATFDKIPGALVQRYSNDQKLKHVWLCFFIAVPAAEYITKVERLRRAMLAAETLAVKNLKASAALRSKVEEKDRARAAKRVADASGYSQVSTA